MIVIDYQGVLEANKARIAYLEADAKRFEWWFGGTDKASFLLTYLDGVRAKWTVDQWRAAIDAEMARATVSGSEQ